MPPRKDAPRGHPARTLEEREAELINLAYDYTEEAIRNKTASSQMVTHFLKAGSAREKKEQERLKNENLLLEAKREDMAARGRIEDLYSKAMDAFRGYQTGEDAPDEDDYDDYD